MFKKGELPLSAVAKRQLTQRNVLDVPTCKQFYNRFTSPRRTRG